MCFAIHHVLKIITPIRGVRHIEFALGDGRKVSINFNPQGNATKVVESFDVENTNSIELQRGGWQAILDNFKKYTEND